MRTPALIFGIAMFPTAFLQAADADGIEFFEKKVRPILVERCFECHSAEKKVKGGLALDTREDWVKGGDSGAAIVPGNPEGSLLFKAVTWEDLDLQMPPKKKLSDTELAVLKEWVKRGAPDPREGRAAVAKKGKSGISVEEGRQFWAYALLKKGEAPEVANKAWPWKELDQFILARIEKAGWAPAKDAEPSALARRLSYVLTGLPPAPERIAKFAEAAKKDRAKALDEYAVELLNSVEYAERWAGHWLNIARFAESSGGGRTLLFKDAWRYRDYVVKAFQENTPLDQMIREQIAGDLLPWKTKEERTKNLIATGFLALGPTIYEEQDKQRLRFDVIDEQIDTIGKAFLGQTVGCARCHDHKFDPISQADYYALAGIFASTRTLKNYVDNVVMWIEAPLPLAPDEEKALSEAEAKVSAAETQLKETKNRLAKLKDKASGLSGKTNQPLPIAGLKGLVIDDAQAVAHGEWKHSTHSKTYFGEGYRHDAGEEKGKKTLEFTPDFPAAGRYEVRLAYPPLAGRATKVPIHIFHSMGDTTVYVNQEKEPDIEGRFTSLGTYHFEKGKNGYVIVSNEDTKGYVCADLVQFLPEGTSTPLVKSESEPKDVKLLEEEARAQEQALAELKKLKVARPVAMTVREEDTIADTNIRVRGEVHQKAALVPRGFLTVVDRGSPQIPTDKSGRAELAEWLVSNNNPLTARVMVNRVWQWLFGEGLVRTVDTFGTTGEAPTHPELLDYLAARFQQEGWDVRKLIREIVTSRAWQLAVATNPQDPENRTLSHAHRRRLDAEQIRDTMLAVSGALDRKVGGPNIKGAKSADPVSPEASEVEFGYVFDDARRSLYTPAFRNNRMELFATFDFTDNNTTQGQRSVSTVAPQALYFMNHPFAVGQSRLAGSKAADSALTESERLDRAFLETLGRHPNPAESAACQKVLASARDEESAQEAWAMIYQSLFGSVDFRYLD